MSENVNSTEFPFLSIQFGLLPKSGQVLNYWLGHLYGVETDDSETRYVRGRSLDWKGTKPQKTWD